MENQMNAIPLTLIKRSSVLDGLVMFESIPIERIKALIKSPFLLMAWGDDYNWDFHKKLIMELYANEKVQIEKYLGNYNKNVNAVSTKYGKPRHKWGRSFPFKSLGLSCFRKVVRNSLLDGIYYDFDLKNCQPEVIKNLCLSNNIPCPIIKRYCEERPVILQQIQDHYRVSRDVAKDLFIRLCFFGSFVGWCLENKLSVVQPLEFITLFERELISIANKIKNVNKDLYETARKIKNDNGENKEHKILGSFFALYNQEYESRIVEMVLCYLMNQTDLLKLAGTTTPTGSYEYDGIKLLKENVDLFEGGVEGVVQLLNEKTFELTGFKLEWSNKPYEELYNLDDWITQVENDEAPNKELIDDCDKILKAISGSDCGIIETIMEILPNNFIFSVDKDDGSRGEWYGWNGNRWEKSDAPLRKAIMYQVKKHWDGILQKWDAIYEDMTFEEGVVPDCNYKYWSATKKEADKRIFCLKSASGIQSCVSVAKTLMANYTLEFDTKEDLFGCENGVIDIAEECFRPYRFDDYITFSCGYDFTPCLLNFKVIEKKLDEDGKVVERKVDKDGKVVETGLTERLLTENDKTQEFEDSFKLVMNVYKKIFPDELLFNYFFKIIATGMSGRPIERFFVFNGAGRNGKGLTNELLEKVLGSYFTKVSPIVFSENQKNKQSASANPEIANLDKKRYVVSKEPQRDAPLQNSVIKDLTGGGGTNARKLYSSNASVKLCGTFIMECNDKPPFSEAPVDADVERIHDILFQSKFTANEEEWDVTTGETNHIYSLDAGLKETLKNSNLHKSTMLNILLQNLLMVKEQNYNIDYFKPESVTLRSLNYLQNSYDIHNIFQNLFEIKCLDEYGHKKEYVNAKGKSYDEDWTLPKIAVYIRRSSEFLELPKSKQKEYKSEFIQNFFIKNKFYKSSIYKNEHKHAVCMKDWRLKPVFKEDSDSDD